MERVDRGAARRGKTDRSAIGMVAGCPFAGFSTKNSWSRSRPSSNHCRRGRQPLQPERFEYAVVERARFRQIVRSDRYMGEYCRFGPPLMLGAGNRAVAARVN